MSRGPGLLQRAILNYFDASPAPTTFETLRWLLWERSRAENAEERHDTAAVIQYLPTKWNTSLRRAIFELERSSSPRLAIEDRRLVSIEEMFDHFPHKTLISQVRSLRLALLRPLSQWTEVGSPPLRYSAAQNEKFHLENRPNALRRLSAQWASLEPSLIALLPSLGAADRMNLFLMIAKGYSLFQTRAVESCRSFGELAGECLDAGIFPPPLREKVVAMDQAILPSDKAGFLRLKSFVHAVVDVPRHRRCRLKKDAIEHLDQVCPHIVRELPGYEPPPTRPIDGRVRWMVDREPKHSEQLHSLIDHSVFQKFRFLRPVN